MPSASRRASRFHTSQVSGFCVWGFAKSNERIEIQICQSREKAFLLRSDQTNTTNSISNDYLRDMLPVLPVVKHFPLPSLANQLVENGPDRFRCLCHDFPLRRDRQRNSQIRRAAPELRPLWPRCAPAPSEFGIYHCGRLGDRNSQETS